MGGVRAATVHFWMFAACCAAVAGLALLGMVRAGVFDSRLEYFDAESLVRPAPKEPNRVVIVMNNPPDESDCVEIITDYGHGRHPGAKQYEKVIPPPPRVMDEDERLAQKRIEQNLIQERIAHRLEQAELKKREQQAKDRAERHRLNVEQEKKLAEIQD